MSIPDYSVTTNKDYSVTTSVHIFGMVIAMRLPSALISHLYQSQYTKSIYIAPYNGLIWWRDTGICQRYVSGIIKPQSLFYQVFCLLYLIGMVVHLPIVPGYYTLYGIA